jgi:hypothetical protein
MNFLEWSRSSVTYGQKLVNSAIEGAQKGEDEFLKDESLAPYLGGSARQALAPAMMGAFLGALGGSLKRGHRSPTRAVAYGLLGGAIGFSAGLIWESREFGASVASSAWKNINQTRDEQWFQKNPIDYA